MGQWTLTRKYFLHDSQRIPRLVVSTTLEEACLVLVPPALRVFAHTILFFNIFEVRV